MNVDREFENIRKEAMIALFMVTSRYVLVGAKRNHKESVRIGDLPPLTFNGRGWTVKY